jgi:mono/diheme cytochrome c family protein
MKRGKKLLAPLALALLLPAPLAAQDASLKSVLTGVYTDAQAERGHQLFLAHCAKCHELSMNTSATVPPLGGDDFMSEYSGQTVDALYQRIGTTMPNDNPGSLDPPLVADLVAFLLKNNHISAGTTELPADDAVLKQIRMDKPPGN